MKNFATKARRELLEKVELQARKIGITRDSIQKANVESSDAIYIDGRQLSNIERKQRNKLIARIEEIGFDQVMEETAYTWFNRFIALRFMEVNEYLPTKVRVLSSSNPASTEPDMIKEALSLDLDIDKEYVYELKLTNKTDELFKYLIKVHCNDLNRYMPFMFETIEDYTEILFPEGLLGTDSFVRDMTNTEVIPEEDWEKVEIIGWLYQYYIAEEKEEIFDNLKKNIKVTKEKLPAATQIFTPNWIVRYMVENSLGRIWLESYPDSSLKSNWKYYLDEAGQEKEVVRQLENIRYKNANPENITLLDPCCGSGHILVYAFDIFYEMYLEKGYIPSEIPKLVLEKNLYGIDIDDRAVQLASFAVLMKAREKSRRVFSQNIKLNISSIQDSNWLTDEIITTIGRENDEVINDLKIIKETFVDAKEFGSLLQIEKLNYQFLDKCFDKYKNEDTDLLDWVNKERIIMKLPQLIQQSKILSRNYDVVCTNPPYLGRRSMNTNLRNYLDKHYNMTKSDLFAAFMERIFNFVKVNGFSSVVTMQSWMFLSSYEKFRRSVINNKTIYSLLHMDNMVMGIAFGTSATIFRNLKVNNYRGTYTEVKYSDLNSKNVPNAFPIKNNNLNITTVEKFNKVPGSPIAYWVKENIINNIFNNGLFLKEFAYSFQGIITGNNDKYLRYWFEPEFQKIAINYTEIENVVGDGKNWVPYNKGGEFRKWYGNNEYVLYWEDDGEHLTRPRTNNKDFYLKKGITWSFLTSSEFSARYFEEGFLWDVAGSSIFSIDEQYSLEEILAFMNSKVSKYILKMYNPTLNFQVENIVSLPYIQSNKHKESIRRIVKKIISIAKSDWDYNEYSWGYKKSPILMFKSKNINDSFQQWKQFADNQFLQLKEYEEELNQMFIEIYGLQDELTSDLSDKDITLHKADLESNIKSFISYAVGCAFGRYSLDEEGLIYAGGEFDPNRYQTFPADQDNILPILPDAYFEDDIVSRFIKFVEVTYGKETLEENLDYIADVLRRKKNETSRETIRRYFLNDFYKDHVQTYKKRPIYWLFTSGKEKAFNCLIYMHRYDKTTLSRIRTDYLHEVQTRYEARKQDLINIIEGDSTSKEIRDAKKELKSIEKKIDELIAYDEKLHHMADQQIEIDLDDGVKVNYEKFKGLVAKL